MKYILIKLQGEEVRIIKAESFDFKKDYADIVRGEVRDANNNQIQDIFIGEKAFKLIFIERLEVLTDEELEEIKKERYI